MAASSSAALAAIRIGARVAYERLAQPKARRPDDVPCSPSAITPEWLTAVLCQNTTGAAVTAVDVRPTSSGTHARHRLTITYNEAGQQGGLPRSIFTKSLPDVVTRMIGGFNGTARAEGHFFTNLRPQLPIEAPLCYHSAFDRDTFAAIHLLEDLVATKSATFCDFRTDVTRDMAEDMIDLLAALHGRFYGDPTLATRYRWLASYTKWFTIGAEKMGTRRYTQKALDAAAHVIPARIRARRDDIWPAMVQSLAVHDSEPQGLLHSDVHIGNWYRTGEGRMGLCDWQCLSRGHWSRDFAYAVTASLSPENRRAWERDLLARYLAQFEAQTGIAQDFETAFSRYRGQIVHALAMWTITLCHSPFLPAMQPEETSLAMIERMTIAMDDLDSLDLPR